MLYYKVVVKRNALVLKVDVAHTEYRAHEAFIEVVRPSTTVYKVGIAYIGIVLPCTC